MSQYGATHEFVVEYVNQGFDEDPQEPGADNYEFTVHYIIRHPADCWPDWKGGEGDRSGMCPITQAIADVGIEDALGLNHWRDGRNVIEHLPEGLYEVNAWATHYSSPNGDDWDGGLEWERKETPPPPPPPPVKFVPFEEA